MSDFGELYEISAEAKSLLRREMNALQEYYALRRQRIEREREASDILRKYIYDKADTALAKGDE